MAIIIGKNSGNNLIGTNKDDLILGLGGDDTLSGGNGNDLLFGGHGNDQVVGGAGNDVVDGGTGNDSIDGGSGNDLLSGGCGNDVVGGGTGNDLLVGGDGNDSLTGGSGADLLAGGSGRDHFIYRQAADSSVAAGWDRILDFTQGQDKIDLSAFRNTSSDLDLVFRGEDPAVPGAWGVWYHNGWNSTWIYADTSGDGIADLKIELKNTCGLNLVASDFIGVSGAQVNSAPVAVADTLAATEDTLETYTAAQLLGNDEDGDPELVQPLTIASVTSGTGGTAVLNADGTVTFTPDLNFNGAANFTYTVSDGLATSAAATVTVNVAAVNDAPVAVADTLAATEDTLETYTAAQLLGNDEDGDPELVQPLTIASVTSGTGGTAVLNADGTVTFTPDVNFNGAANFTYTVSDGLAASAAATVTVNVAAVNDAPVAVADTLAATEDTPVTYTAAQLLGNDTDVDTGTVLAIASVASGTGGTALLNADGTVTFTPEVNFNGAANFTYTVSDGLAASAAATVTVNVAAVNETPTVAGLVVTETSISFVASDADNATLSLASPFANAFGDPTITSGATTTLTPTQQAPAAVSGTLQVTDGAATANVVGLFLGTSGSDTATAPLAGSPNAMYGFAGADSLTGGTGADSLFGGAGNDTIAGGAGIDTLDYADSPARVIVNMFNNTDITIDGVFVPRGSASDGFGSTDTISGFENVIGSNFDDYIQGATNVANRLDGGAGNDTLAGSGANDATPGTMDDTLVGGAGNDVLRQTRGHDSIDGGADFDRLEFVGNGINYGGFIGVNVNLGAGTSDADPNNGDTVNGAGGDIATVSGIEHVLGTAGNDTLTGDASANLLDGQGGNDTLMGGAGNDTIDGGAGSDRIDFADATGGINFTLNQGTNPGDLDGLWSSGALAGIGTDFYKNIEGVFGSNFADTLTGSSGNDTIRGQGGDDTINAGAGNDIIRGGAGNDTIDGGGGDSDQISFADSTVAGAGINFTLVQDSSDTVVDLTAIGLGTDTYRNIEGVVGTSFNDTLTGSSGNDLIRGGAGNDTIFGGAGNDRFDFSDATAGINFTLIQGSNSGTFWSTGALPGLGTDLYMDMEGVVGTNFSDVLTGSTGSDSLLGGLGNDLLFQTLGNDTIDGGEDFDTLSFNDGVGGGVNVNLATHVSTHGANAATVTAIESVIGTASDDTLTGGDAMHAPDFLGDSIIETFRPLGGNDNITGGAGNGFNTRVDYSSNTNAQAVSANLGAGTLSDGQGGIDTLVRVDQVYGGAGNDSLLGGGQERTAAGGFFELFRGNSGADTIDGAGTDTVLGAAGNNRANYGSSPAAVIVNLGAAPFVVGLDTVPGGTARDGFGFTDTLLNINQVEGSSSSDTLVGGGTDHRLIGGAGNDLLVGGASGVEASYQTSTVAVVANLTLGTVNDGFGGLDTLVNIDDLYGSGFNDTLTGNTVNNRITGESGADTIDGGAGIDYASYSATPLANGGINAFIENGSGAVNDGMGSIDTLTNIEGLIGTHSGDTLSGGLGDQWFIGRGGSDVINGGADTDTVSYIDDPAGVTVNLNAGLATDGWGGVWGFGGTDTLTSIENVQGSNFNDTLIGNSGDNTLTGSAGTDIMTGNEGSDTFKFNATSDSSTTLALSDLIKDFVNGIDKIDLSDIDANTGIGGDQDFAFVALANADTVANSITWSETGGGNTILQIDNNGDTAADMQIVLEGTGLGLTDADFIL